jgi:ankyrin repeat protein
MRIYARFAMAGLFLAASAVAAGAQTPPSRSELAAYQGIHRAAANGDLTSLAAELAAAPDIEARDRMGRTAFHVAAYQRQTAIMQALVAKGANANALEGQAYDAVTIAAVANDVETLRMALAVGNKASNITSPYDGTALIAAAHLGHVEVVRLLIEAGAPLDHINNLGWTALIEAVVLGDGGPRHQETVELLVKAGADKTIADRSGVTPLEHARQRGYGEIVALIEK